MLILYPCLQKPYKEQQQIINEQKRQLDDFEKRLKALEKINNETSIMKDNNFNDLPEWHDRFDDEGEEWKPNPTKQACKALYQQWGIIMTMLKGGLDIDKLQKETGENWTTDYQAMMLGDAMQVAAKIRSSEAGGMYVIRMENASIIRKNAQAVQSSMLLFMEEGVIEKKYGEIIRNEIEIFKGLFKTWVSTFEKDEFTDEWGLFV